MFRVQIGVMKLCAMVFFCSVASACAQTQISPAQNILPPQVKNWESLNDPPSYIAIQGNIATIYIVTYTLENVGVYPGKILWQTEAGQTYKVAKSTTAAVTSGKPTTYSF